MMQKKTSFVLGCALLLLVGCASDEVDLKSSPYTQAATIKDMGGTYKVGKPYQIMGQWYYPKEDYTYSEEGIASWYGEDFHAKKTANGEEYNMNTLTAAHRTLPLPSIVRVTNLENGRSLVLRVNDRGPYAKNRIIDISKRGAELLGFKTKGTAKVRVEVLPKESVALKQALLEQDFEPNYALYNAKSEAFNQEVPPPSTMVPEVQQAQLDGDRNYLVGAGSQAAAETAEKIEIVSREEVKVPAMTAGGGKKFFVQAGAFSKQESAKRLSSQLSKVGAVNLTQATVQGNPFYRVRLGPYNDTVDAEATVEKLRNYGINDARVVKDEL